MGRQIIVVILIVRSQVVQMRVNKAKINELKKKRRWNKLN
jgi:hypothetical protein